MGPRAGPRAGPVPLGYPVRGPETRTRATVTGYLQLQGALRVDAAAALCGELSTGEYHAQYERSSGWVWTGPGGLEARQGVATQDWGSPDTTLKQNSKPEFNPTPSSELGLNTPG